MTNRVHDAVRAVLLREVTPMDLPRPPRVIPKSRSRLPARVRSLAYAAAAALGGVRGREWARHQEESDQEASIAPPPPKVHTSWEITLGGRTLSFGPHKAGTP